MKQRPPADLNRLRVVWPLTVKSELTLEKNRDEPTLSLSGTSHLAENFPYNIWSFHCKNYPFIQFVPINMPMPIIDVYLPLHSLFTVRNTTQPVSFDDS